MFLHLFLISSFVENLLFCCEFNADLFVNLNL
jgi:hypothetical protein